MKVVVVFPSPLSSSSTCRPLTFVGGSVRQAEELDVTSASPKKKLLFRFAARDLVAGEKSAILDAFTRYPRYPNHLMIDFSPELKAY